MSLPNNDITHNEVNSMLFALLKASNDNDGHWIPGLGGMVKMENDSQTPFQKAMMKDMSKKIKSKN